MSAPRPEARALRDQAALRTVAALVGSVVAAMFCAAQGDVVLGSLGLLVGLLPVVAHGVMCQRLRRPLTELQPATMFAAAGSLFLSAGWLNHLSHGGTIQYVVYGRLPIRESFTVLFVLAGVSTLLVIGAHIGWRPSPFPATAEQPVLLYACLAALALSGSLLTIARLGGLEAATAVLSSHDRVSRAAQAGSLGPRLWATFSIPALAGLGIMSTTPGRSTTRTYSIVGYFVLAFLSTTVYGSRLTIALAAIATLAAQQRRLRFLLSARALGVGLLAFLALSGFVLTNRAALQGQADRAQTGVLQRSTASLSYGVYDVALAVTLRPTALREHAFALDRNWLLLRSTAPNPLGPPATDIERSRLDSIVGDSIGRSTDIGRTGLPPSLPVALVYGLPTAAPVLGALLIGAAFGAGAAAVNRWRGPATSLVWGLFVAFSFNAFKSGDPVLDLAGQTRTIVYVVVLAAALEATRLGKPKSRAARDFTRSNR